ncbi:arylsulfatase B [Dermacentor silvarum]|uniref:arylsulfatase B n=1 Tax=Dermacentor silvarum TaxID=543639 RepID=UPI002101260E|nr:arylsulfatase B [Dermacentor silvarum]
MFLYVAHYATHYSTAPERLEVPEHYMRGYEFIRHANRTRYAGMVAALDYSVGQIVSALDEAGILNNTFLVFTSDNGAPTTFWETHGASSWPLRGEKDTLFEGGVRVPGNRVGPSAAVARRGNRVRQVLPRN